jgi:hypothetical protein
MGAEAVNLEVVCVGSRARCGTAPIVRPVTTNHLLFRGGDKATAAFVNSTTRRSISSQLR